MPVAINRILYALLWGISTTAGLILLSRKLMHFFQLESYQFRGYFQTLLRQWKKCLLPGVIAAAIMMLVQLIFGMASYAGILFPAAAALLMAWQMGKKPEKKKFVMTARVKRLYGFLIGLILLLQGLSLGFFMGEGGPDIRYAISSSLQYALLPLLVALSAVLAYPVERLIFRLYFKDAEKKLMENPRLIRIGITGSYGKTSVKFILAEILSQKYNVLATPASFNTPMGVTRIIRERLTPAHQVFIGEMGARHVGEIKELAGLVHPTIGLLTAVGPQHLDTFKTIERIEKTKYELIDALPEDGLAVFAEDGAIVTKLWEKTKKPKKLIGREGADAWAENIRVSPSGSHFTLCLKGWEPIECETRLLGRHNITNILMASVTAKELGLTKEQISRGILNLKPVEHRLQLLRNPGNITVIDDAFNTNPRSSKEALHVLSSFPGRRVIVTPGMVELGAEEERYNYEFGQHMAGCVDVAVLVGKKHTAPIAKGLREKGFPEENIHITASLDEAIALNRGMLRPGDVVMYENDLPDHYSEG